MECAREDVGNSLFSLHLEFRLPIIFQSLSNFPLQKNQKYTVLIGSTFEALLQMKAFAESLLVLDLVLMQPYSYYKFVGTKLRNY